MDLLPNFLQAVSKHHLQNAKVILAVSGGVDSIVLCELSKQAGLSFSIAHCNFTLRGEESERDEAFVNTIALKYSVVVYVKRFDTAAFAGTNHLSIQEAARKLRYEWFEELRNETGSAAVLLAHHANDNIETLLMNFFRGTGLDGLTGMPEVKEGFHCIRPMLEMRRKEIETFALQSNLQWVEDSSNRSGKYTRNFFRNEIIPQLQKVYPQVEENLLNNIKRFQQTAVVYNEMMEGLKKKMVEMKGEEVHIPVLKLMKYKHTSLIYEIIKDYGFTDKYVEEVIKLAEADSGKYIANKQYRIIRHRKWFIISPITALASTFIIDRDDDLLVIGDKQITIKKIRTENFVLSKSPLLAQLDANELEFPLVLRRWKTGDYFYPLGMRKKKKLSRFFIDLKLSKTDKEKVWVLESHKRIVWVVGYRIDDRFKITSGTKEMVQLSLSKL